MSNINMVALKELAKDLLNISFEYDEFYKYIMSIIPFSIKIPDGFGNEVECVSVKMEAIYDYYRNNPQSGIDKQLYHLLAKHIYECKSMDTLIAMLRMIEYQIVSEHTETAPFKIDNESLLLNLKKNIQDNKKIYESDLYEKRNFLGIIQQHNDDLMVNYGHRIM